MPGRDLFTSRWGLILASIGMAIGAGNIWRFPRLVAQNGGSAFLIPWAIFLFLWSIPLLIAEFAIGKHTRQGTIGSFSQIMGKKFAWMGAFVGFVTMGIMFYYSVVTGGAVNVCVYHTVMGFHLRNYWTVLPVDCVYYINEAAYGRALEQLSEERPYPNVLLSRSDLIDIAQV